jgi:hypothetical protein
MAGGILQVKRKPVTSRSAASLPFGVWIGLPLRYESSIAEQNISHSFELSYLTNIIALK